MSRIARKLLASFSEGAIITLVARAPASRHLVSGGRRRVQLALMIAIYCETQSLVSLRIRNVRLVTFEGGGGGRVGTFYLGGGKRASVQDTNPAWR